MSGYTATVRNVPSSERAAVFAAYGIINPPSGAYEVDHLVSLELGGSNDIGNLWPEPYTGVDNAHDKDVWENRLHTQVCSGAITLATAQNDIVHWWVLLGVTGPAIGNTPVTASPSVTQPPTDSGLRTITPGAYCTPIGDYGTYNGNRYLCATTNASDAPYSGGRAHWRRG